MNYHDLPYMLDTLHEHAVRVPFCRDNIFGIFAVGSWNYGLDEKTSDVDSKCLVLPSVWSIAQLCDPYSGTFRVIESKKDEVTAIDIRNFFKQIRKQNPNTLEILFTPAKLVNEKFSEEANWLNENRESIARIDEKSAVLSMRGMAEHCYRKTDKPKNIYHLARLEELIDKYVTRRPYSECLLSDQAGTLKSLKNKTTEDNPKLITYCDYIIEKVRKKTQDFLDMGNPRIDYRTKDNFDGILFRIIRKSFLDELDWEKEK